MMLGYAIRDMPFRVASSSLFLCSLQESSIISILKGAGRYILAYVYISTHETWLMSVSHQIVRMPCEVCKMTFKGELKERKGVRKMKF